MKKHILASALLVPSWSFSFSIVARRGESIHPRCVHTLATVDQQDVSTISTKRHNENIYEQGRRGNWRLAVDLAEELGSAANTYTFNALLVGAVASSSKAPQRVAFAFEWAEERSIQPDVVSMNTALKQWFCTDPSVIPGEGPRDGDGAVPEARGALSQAESFVEKLFENCEVCPDGITINSLVQIAIRGNQLARAEFLVQNIGTSALCRDDVNVAYSQLAVAHGAMPAGLEKSVHFFSLIGKPNIIAATAMANILLGHDKAKEALALLEACSVRSSAHVCLGAAIDLSDCGAPDQSFYNTVLKSYRHLGDVDSVLALLSEMAAHAENSSPSRDYQSWRDQQPSDESNASKRARWQQMLLAVNELAQCGGIRVDQFSLSTAIAACLNADRPNEALGIINKYKTFVHPPTLLRLLRRLTDIKITIDRSEAIVNLNAAVAVLLKQSPKSSMDTSEESDTKGFDPLIASAASECYDIVSDACVRLGQPLLLKSVLNAASADNVGIENRSSVTRSLPNIGEYDAPTKSSNRAASAGAEAALSAVRVSFGRRLRATLAAGLRESIRQKSAEQNGGCAP